MLQKLSDFFLLNSSFHLFLTILYNKYVLWEWFKKKEEKKAGYRAEHIIYQHCNIKWLNRHHSHEENVNLYMATFISEI